MLFRRASRRDVYVRSRKDFASLWWLLVIPLCFSTAQGQYRFDHWTADTGLPQNSVYSMLQTRDGYLWLTTLDGLVRFDGVRFTVFNKGNSAGMASNRLLSLFAEADGTLWLGTEDGGLVRFRHGQSNTFTTADGLPSNQVNAVQKDLDGSLLILTTNGLARWREGRITVERQGDDRNYKIYVSPANARWEVDARGLQRRTPDGRATNYALTFDPQRISPDRTFNYFSYVRMLEDRDGALWLSASGNVYRMRDGAVTTYTAADGVPPSLVTDILQDRQGGIWLATREDGICRSNADRFACYNTTGGLSSNHVMDLFEDREGTLWAGTNERGINRLTRQVVTPLSSADGLADKNVYPLLEARDGSVWIGSVSALSHYKDGKVKNYTRRDGLLYEIVQSLHEDRDGRLWIGSVGGVEYYEDGKFTDFTERLGLRIGDVDFWAIQQDRHGALWFGTDEGLIRYQDGVATRYTTENGLPSNDVKAIHEARDGSLWIGTYGGVVRMSVPPAMLGGSHVAQTRPLPQAVLTEREGLASNHVRAIFEDAQSTLWIGTYDGGLSRYADGKFVNYTTQNGLYSNGVFQILEDRRGWFWMSSNQGIYRVSRQQLEDFAAGKTATITATAFGKSDGMLNTECNGGRQPAGIKTRDGKLWFPTQDGVAIIDPEAVPFNPHSPPVVIESIRLENQTLDNLPSMVEMPPGQDHLEINYTGLSFIKPEQIRFRYKLEGLEQNWTEAGGRRTAYFSYLPPGNYTFRVIAANSDNVWNEEGAALSVVVLPPFYRTWWFTLIAAFSVIAATFLTVRYRIRQLHLRHQQQQNFARQLLASQEAERKRIAAELHDSLGQTLLVIKNRAFMGARATANGEATSKQLTAANEQFDEISAAAAEAINEAREISYHLRPSQLERLGLTASIKEMIEHVAQASNIQFETDIAPLDGVFSNEAEINFYRIAQESLNNIVKHSGASAVQFRIRHDGRAVELMIRDNGKGFEPNASGANGSGKTGFGLTSIAERTRILGGRHSIESSLGHGTTLIVRIGELKS